MAEVIYREVPREFTIVKRNSEFEVTVHGRKSNQSTNIRPGGWHSDLRMNFDELSAVYEQCGGGPHSHVVRIPIGTTDFLFQPMGSDQPSR